RGCSGSRPSCWTGWPPPSIPPTPGTWPRPPSPSPAGPCAGGWRRAGSIRRMRPRWSGSWPWPGARPERPTSVAAEESPAPANGCAWSPAPDRTLFAGAVASGHVAHDRDPNLGPIVVSEEQLRTRIAELGRLITDDYEDRSPLLLVGVLKGAFVFMSDLARAIDVPVESDFMAVSSYGSATKTSGVVRIVKDLDLDLTDRDVVLVEDIVDSGLTLHYLLKNLLARNPASLEVCALIVQDGIQQVEPE